MKKWLRSGISFMLAFAMIVSAAGFVRAETTGETVDITQGLLAHYDFETVNDTTVSNNVTTNTTTTAELKNGAVVVDSNKLGKAMKLLNNSQGMQLTNIVNAAESSFSVSMWYRLDGPSESNVNLFQAGTIGGSTGRTILILKPDSSYRSFLTAQNVDTATSVVRTEWQHITFAYDREANKGYFYVNGVLANAGGTDMGATAPLSTADMIVGRHRSLEGAFNGLIDEVRVYNKPVTAEEAAAIYAYGPLKLPTRRLLPWSPVPPSP